MRVKAGRSILFLRSLYIWDAARGAVHSRTLSASSTLILPSQTYQEACLLADSDPIALTRLTIAQRYTYMLRRGNKVPCWGKKIAKKFPPSSTSVCLTMVALCLAMLRCSLAPTPLGNETLMGIWHPSHSPAILPMHSCVKTEAKPPPIYALLKRCWRARPGGSYWNPSIWEVGEESTL